MHLDISAFTHVGTERPTNQDHILVNTHLLNDGEIHLLNQNDCCCFVADGVGGNQAGEFASHFILEKIKSVSPSDFPELDQLVSIFNHQLIQETTSNNLLKGSATTLTGLIANEHYAKIIHAGDSQMWLLRNDMFFQLTHDQVLNEAVENSPITSYLGGYDDQLKFDLDSPINELLVGDVLLICSDGLFKSLNYKMLKSILKADKDLATKAKKILENCLQIGAVDNVSVILVHQVK